MAGNLSSLIDSLAELKRRKKALEAQVKEVDKAIDAMEFSIMGALDADGIIESKSAVGKVALSESVYPHVEQWDLFGDYVLDNRFLHLLERRPSVTAYRELLTLGRIVPGVLPFTKRKLTFKET